MVGATSSSSPENWGPGQGQARQQADRGRSAANLPRTVEVYGGINFYLLPLAVEMQEGNR